MKYERNQADLKAAYVLLIGSEQAGDANIWQLSKPILDIVAPGRDASSADQLAKEQALTLFGANDTHTPYEDMHAMVQYNARMREKGAAGDHSDVVLELCIEEGGLMQLSSETVQSIT